MQAEVRPPPAKVFCSGAQSLKKLYPCAGKTHGPFRKDRLDRCRTHCRFDFVCCLETISLRTVIISQPKNPSVETNDWLWYKSVEMIRRVLKISVVLALSIALMYSGVAWAIDNCLREAGHSHDGAGAEHDHAQQHSDHDRSSKDSPSPIIHCTSLFPEAGPAAVVKSFTLAEAGKILPLYIAAGLDAISEFPRTNVWLQALFKRILTFSSRFDRTRHLSLSVLQI